MYKGKILELIREKNSTNGNPRFTAVIQDSRGFIELATTAPDSSLSYGLQNHAGKWVRYETAIKRNRMTLVSVEPAEQTVTGRYIELEFNALPDSPVYKMQVTGCSTDGETGRTKWVNVSAVQLEKIREILANQ